MPFLSWTPSTDVVGKDIILPTSLQVRRNRRMCVLKREELEKNGQQSCNSFTTDRLFMTICFRYRCPALLDAASALSIVGNFQHQTAKTAGDYKLSFVCTLCIAKRGRECHVKSFLNTVCQPIQIAAR